MTLRETTGIFPQPPILPILKTPEVNFSVYFRDVTSRGEGRNIQCTVHTRTAYVLYTRSIVTCVCVRGQVFKPMFVNLLCRPLLEFRRKILHFAGDLL